MSRVQLFAIIGSLVLLLVIIDAIRKRRILEQYSLVWLLTGFVLLFLSIWRDLLDNLSAFIGIYYPPSVLLLIGSGLLVLILLSFSAVVSKEAGKVARLTQRLALLEFEVGRLRSQDTTIRTIERANAEPDEENRPKSAAEDVG